MYCSNCGKSVNDNQEFCLGCGVKVGTGNSFCPNCGNPRQQNAVFCLGCGISFTQVEQKTGYLNGQDKTTISIICFFLGGLGIHNFMMGEKKRGIAKILLSFVGVSSILALIDFIKILSGSYCCNENDYF